MDENKIFEDQSEVAPPDGKKPFDTVSMALGMAAVIAAALVPLISYVCGVVGLVMAVRDREKKRTTVGIILCSIGLLLGVVSNYLAARMILSAAALF